MGRGGPCQSWQKTNGRNICLATNLEKGCADKQTEINLDGPSDALTMD